MNREGARLQVNARSYGCSSLLEGKPGIYYYSYYIKFFRLLKTKNLTEFSYTLKISPKNHLIEKERENTRVVYLMWF